VARSETKTAVLPDGLRYKSKVSGSPFVATTSFGSATMSCFMCGKHRPRSMMGTRKFWAKPRPFARHHARRWMKRSATLLPANSNFTNSRVAGCALSVLERRALLNRLSFPHVF
jgi:hypothetical protein